MLDPLGGIRSPLDGFPSPLAARRGGAAFGASITGLTGGEARIGGHASIGYSIDPDNGTETVKWSNSSDPGDPATYGTGANPTDYTAGDEGSLWLHVTDGGETVSRSAPIRYAPGTASAIADGQTFTVDSAITPIDASASGANLTFTYALSGGPAGVSINPTTGSITGTPSAASSGTATITATDQYGRTLQDTFTFTASLRTQATAADELGPFNWTVDDTTVNVDATADFTTNSNTLTYTATGLPAGVTIATNGIISGTPTAASSGSIVITGQDEYGRETTSTTSHTTALRTQATGGTDLDLSFAEDSPITPEDLLANWTDNGNTLTFVSVSPALPTGLSINSSGSLSGTPTTTTADDTYTLTMEDEYSRQTSDTFTLEITAFAYSVSIGSGPVETGTQLTATVSGLVGGETVTYEWKDDGVAISGATSSTYTVAIGTDSVADASDISVTCTVDAGPEFSSGTREVRYAAGSVTESGLSDWTIDDDALNVNLASDFTTTNLTGTYVITGLPSGAVDDGDGTISGTADGTPETASITCTFTDQYGRTIVGSYSVDTVYRAQATGGTDLDLSFVEDSAISSTDLKANWTTNGNTLTYAITGTALPTGLSVSSAGVMTGTPIDVTADATYTLRGTDEYGRTTDDTFTLEITAAASGFTPAGLFSGGDNGVWYDVHPDYCYTDAGKTTNATVGDAVYVLEDRSGKGNDATQASASSRPVLRQDANSNYYLEFDGIDDVMAAPSAAWVSLSGYSAFFVGSHDEPTASIAYIFVADDAVRLSQFLRLKADTGVGVTTIPFNTSGSAFSASTGVAVRDTIYVAGAVCDGTNLTARLDGVAGTASTITGTIQTASEPLQIAARTTTETEIHFYGGVLINRGLSSGEISDLETWLADKGNVTL